MIFSWRSADGAALIVAALNEAVLKIRSGFQGSGEWKGAKERMFFNLLF